MVLLSVHYLPGHNKIASWKKGFFWKSSRPNKTWLVFRKIHVKDSRSYHKVWSAWTSLVFLFKKNSHVDTFCLASFKMKCKNIHLKKMPSTYSGQGSMNLKSVGQKLTCMKPFSPVWSQISYSQEMSKVDTVHTTFRKDPMNIRNQKLRRKEKGRECG